MAQGSVDRATSRILLVDDDSDLLALLSLWLESAGYSVVTAVSGEQALARLPIDRPDLVVTDLRMAGIDGLKLLYELHRSNPLLPVVILSGKAGIQDAVSATRMGASAFLTKPIDQQRLVTNIGQVLERWGASRGSAAADFGATLVARSAAMQELLQVARLVAAGDSMVCIRGETGVGKELLAKAIHEGGRRRHQRFLAINCGALPEALLESELFGHEKGAFTGALRRHAGMFQSASHGSLFLDEIGDMPPTAQMRLLRVLEDGEVRPVGSAASVPIDVRIISATHRDLEQAVAQGEFREDLYYRLNVVPLRVPSLAERREDIPLLAEHLLSEIAKRQNTPRKRLAPEALRYLVSAPWPGNVRQLANTLEHCAVLALTEMITLGLVRRALRDRPFDLPTLEGAHASFERDYLISVLTLTNGNVTNAARIAARNRTDFYKLLARHEIDPVRFRQDG